MIGNGQLMNVCRALRAADTHLDRLNVGEIGWDLFGSNPSEGLEWPLWIVRRLRFSNIDGE